MSTDTLDSGLSPRNRKIWAGVQVAVFLVGVAMLAAMFVAPEVGLAAFWSVLIPVAPALLVFAPGLWRNICPLASTAAQARRLAPGNNRAALSIEWQGRLTMIGLVLLLVMVPLRHAWLDLDGPATAAAIGGLAVIAVLCGAFIERKSGWCMGLCPVHPVEKLYGMRPMVSVPNSQCHTCVRCVTVCADSTPAMHPLRATPTRWHRVAGVILVGGFAGFVWGWFQVQDYANGEGWANLASIYAWPFGGLAVTLAVYLALDAALGERGKEVLPRIFAAAAVACYYWYRLPALFGFTMFANDGVLVDLTAVLTETHVAAMRIATTVVFVWWIVLRRPQRRAWGVRPPIVEPEATAAVVVPAG